MKYRVPMTITCLMETEAGDMHEAETIIGTVLDNAVGVMLTGDGGSMFSVDGCRITCQRERITRAP